jgi:quercetin dioxygenase-like cupin family protein
MMKRILLLTATALIVAAPAQGKGMKWMDATGAGLPAGAKMAVVSGNPAKAGPFVIRAKFPANYTVPPHSHPGDEVVRVLNGATLTYGMGDKVDTANSGSLTKGYHVTMQAGMNHWVTTSAPTDIQVSGNGPFGITYVNPADDPRTKK